MHIKAISVAWSYDPELASLHAGIIKAIVSFYSINSDTAFERHRSRIPINHVNTVQALKQNFVSFLGLKELSSKDGLGDFEIKIYRMATKLGEKRDNFAITTDEQWKLELPSLLDDTGNEMVVHVCICSVWDF